MISPDYNKAVGDKALAAVPRDLRDQVRADVLKNVLILQV